MLDLFRIFPRYTYIFAMFGVMMDFVNCLMEELKRLRELSMHIGWRMKHVMMMQRIHAEIASNPIETDYVDKKSTRYRIQSKTLNFLNLKI